MPALTVADLFADDEELLQTTNDGAARLLAVHNIAARGTWQPLRELTLPFR